ncbi:MAG: DUF6599 family protein [Candidatus Aminicenantales bacterium]
MFPCVKILSVLGAVVISAGILAALGDGQERRPNPALAALAPQAGGWKQAEEPRSFFPENLYEYIDGAAESYLSYDFHELLVLQLKSEAKEERTLTVEIYDMGQPTNAFGIFSAERYPENAAVPVGDLGYIEGETLNFMAGRFYVKLLSFGLGDGTAQALTDYAQKLAGAVAEKGVLPALLQAFPKENLVPQSEKYIKKNFLGYEFLHDGYMATYKIDGQELECFLAESGSDKDAEAALSQLLEIFAKDKQVPEKIALGYHVKNRYAQHMYIGCVRNVICGTMRVPDGLEAAGEAYANRVAESVARMPPAKK